MQRSASGIATTFAVTSELHAEHEVYEPKVFALSAHHCAQGEPWTATGLCVALGHAELPEGNAAHALRSLRGDPRAGIAGALALARSEKR